MLASSLAVEVRRLLGAGEPLVYAYYEGVDKIAHVHGFGEHYDAELVALDRMVADLLDALPPGAVLAVTADHGQVEVGPRAKVIDPGLATRLAMMSGEARFRWLHARTGTVARRRSSGWPEVTEDLYGNEAWVRDPRRGWRPRGGSAARSPPRCGPVWATWPSCPFEPVAYLDPAESSTRSWCAATGR